MLDRKARQASATRPLRLEREGAHFCQAIFLQKDIIIHRTRWQPVGGQTKVLPFLTQSGAATPDYSQRQHG